MEDGFRARPGWLPVLILILIGQAGLALERFGSWSAVTDDRPLLDGRHPLHLYHGTLGAETFRQRYATACFDPAFQAGYPKTPVFDGGCRPAELMIYLAGSGNETAAMKVGLFVMMLSVPLVFAVAARGLGISAAGACAAAAIGACLWWTTPVQSLFDSGDIDLLLAGLCALVFLAWLSRYHWEPGPTSWLVLAGTAVIGWYAHPVIWLGLLPVVAAYYIMAAPRHGPAWHLGLAGITLIGLGLNLWWLYDWGRFWWLRQPSVDELAPFPTWGALLGQTSDNLALFGEGLLGWPLILTGLTAAALLFLLGRRSASFIVVLAGLLAGLVTRLGEAWSPFINGGAERAAPLVAGLAVLPVAGLLALWANRAVLGPPLLLLLSLVPLSLAWGGQLTDPLRRSMHCTLPPLRLGLTDEQQTFVQGLIAQTTDEARILIEDVPPGSRPGWNWTALLPTLTGRAFLGGLDPDARFEHAYCSLMNHRLNGRPLEEWSDTDLAAFATRYNVGWVAARTPITIARWQALPMAREIARYSDGGTIVLFALERPRSFILAGSAKWEQADRRKVVLTDVMPADAPHPDGGPLPAKVIVLSLHHQPGLRINPNIVIVERDPCPHDPIPMLRLRMTAPLSRIVISWENR